MRRIFTLLLCFCVSWTTIVPAYAQAPVVPPQWDEARIRSEYPNARIVHVSAEEYPAVEAELLRKGYQPNGERLMLARGYEDLERERTVAPESVARYYDECSGSSEKGERSDPSFNVVLDQFRGFDNRDAMLLFVVIGTVVVVVWSVYAVKFAYDVVAGYGLCGRWSDFAIASSTISSSGDDNAHFTGARLLSGFREGNTDFGLGGEVGYADMKLTEVNSLKLHGTYWLLGPVLRWRMGQASNPDYFQMEFLAGSTSNRETGLLAQAKLGVNFGYANGFRWGLNMGAMNINLKSNQGIITKRSKYYYVFGLETGFRF